MASGRLRIFDPIHIAWENDPFGVYADDKGKKGQGLYFNQPKH